MVCRLLRTIKPSDGVFSSVIYNYFLYSLGRCRDDIRSASAPCNYKLSVTSKQISCSHKITQTLRSKAKLNIKEYTNYQSEI